MRASQDEMRGEVGQDVPEEKAISSRPPEEDRFEDGIEDASEMHPPGKRSLSPLWWIILCSSLLVAEMQASLETTMTADLQLTIINTFGEISKFPWINVTYSLALGSSCLFW